MVLLTSLGTVAGGRLRVCSPQGPRSMGARGRRWAGFQLLLSAGPRLAPAFFVVQVFEAKGIGSIPYSTLEHSLQPFFLHFFLINERLFFFPKTKLGNLSKYNTITIYSVLLLLMEWPTFPDITWIPRVVLNIYH